MTSANDPENDRISVTWWLTTGATERKLGSGSTVTVSPGTGSEIRAVASDGKSPATIARISLAGSVAEPELTLSLAKNPRTLRFGESVPFKLEGLDPSKAAAATVRARYIPATGHDAGGPQFPEQIAAVVTSNQCLACHQVDMPSVGPRYLDVALKYRDRPDAGEYLRGKLKTGGAGAWGEVPMPPQIALSDEHAGQIVGAILGLANGISEVKGSINGQIQLAPKPAAAEAGGAWEFTAEAPGFTSAKFRIPAG